MNTPSQSLLSNGVMPHQTRSSQVSQKVRQLIGIIAAYKEESIDKMIHPQS